jgi:hypothetical protein
MADEVTSVAFTARRKPCDPPRRVVAIGKECVQAGVPARDPDQGRPLMQFSIWSAEPGHVIHVVVKGAPSDVGNFLFTEGTQAGTFVVFETSPDGVFLSSIPASPSNVETAYKPLAVSATGSSAQVTWIDINHKLNLGTFTF